MNWDHEALLEEQEKCQYYRDVIHAIARGTCVKLKEKIFITTESPKYEFKADKVMDLTDFVPSRIEIYNSDNFIHCNSIFLDSVQMKELARVVASSKLS